MTQKDYIKLAQALKDSKPDDSIPTMQVFPVAVQASIMQWKSTVEMISLTLQHDNLRFNRSRFLRACGYNE